MKGYTILFTLLTFQCALEGNCMTSIIPVEKFKWKLLAYCMSWTLLFPTNLIPVHFIGLSFLQQYFVVSTVCCATHKFWLICCHTIRLLYHVFLLILHCASTSIFLYTPFNLSAFRRVVCGVKLCTFCRMPISLWRTYYTEGKWLQSH